MHPDWSRAATLYELNTRQFTEAGTFRAAEAHLPRLAELGVDIIWLMPIHPIGVRNRKGTLGSPYSVRDYYGVNPEFGTLDDLKRFVAAAHDRGMHVILDWVANHTSWDNPLVVEHPDWYARDTDGALQSTPWWDWSDVVDLDYGQPGLHAYMIDAMAYWVREAGIDGFRCDVAGYVPTAFWEAARAALDAIRPVFLLAEWESRDLHDEAFDATYAWTWNDALHAIARGAADTGVLVRYYSWRQKAWPSAAMRMTFIANHDTNTWKGTQFERFGEALHAAIVLSVVGDGIPLLYSGQEAGNERRLAFFEKDPIGWREHPVGELYRRLFALKHRVTALHNAPWGALMAKVPNNAESGVLSFVRANERDGVFAVFNVSADARIVRFAGTRHHGTYAEYRTGEPASFTASTTLALEPWAHRVYERRGS
ncbi:MAG: alpha-amylase family glycosyl hydrolase [Gemmatimonadota bacterium]